MVSPWQLLGPFFPYLFEIRAFLRKTNILWVDLLRLSEPVLLQILPIHMHSCVCGAESKSHRVADEACTQSSFYEFYLKRSLCSHHYILSCQVVRYMSLGKSSTHQAIQASSSTWPCCRKSAMKWTSLSLTATDQPHQALHGPSKAVEEHSHTVLFECRWEHFHSAQASQVEFPLQIQIECQYYAAYMLR